MQIRKIKFFKKLEHWEKPHIWRVSFSESKGFQRDSFFMMLGFGMSASQTPKLLAAQRSRLHVSFSCGYLTTNSETVQEDPAPTAPRIH